MKNTNQLLDELLNEIDSLKGTKKRTSVNFTEKLREIGVNLGKDYENGLIPKEMLDNYLFLCNDDKRGVQIDYMNHRYEEIYNKIKGVKKKYNSYINYVSNENEITESKEVDKEKYLTDLINTSISLINETEEMDNIFNNLIKDLTGTFKPEVNFNLSTTEIKNVLNEIYENINEEKKEDFLRLLDKAKEVSLTSADIKGKQENIKNENNNENRKDEEKELTENTTEIITENNVGNESESNSTNIEETEQEELSFETDGPAIKKYKEETEKLEEEIRKLEELEQNEELILDETSKNILNQLEKDIKEQEQTLETYKRRRDNLIERNNPSNNSDKTYTLEVIKNAEYQIREQTKIVENLKIKYKQTKKELEERYKENRIKELEEKYKEIEIEQDNYYNQNKGVPVELYGRKKAIEDELNRLQNSSKKKELEQRKQELEERKNNIKIYYECLEEIKQINNIDKNSEEYKNRVNKLNEKIATLPNELKEELRKYLKVEKKVKKKKGLKVKAKRALNWIKEHKLAAIAIGLALLGTTYLTLSSLMVINSGLWGLLGGKGAICSTLHGINKGLSKIVGFGQYNFASSGLYLNNAGQALYEATAPKLIEALTLLGGSGLVYKKIIDKIKSISNKKEEPEKNNKEKESQDLESEGDLKKDNSKEKSTIIDKIKEKGSTIITNGKEKIDQISEKYSNKSENNHNEEDKTVENNKKETTNLTKDQIAEIIKEEVEKQNAEILKENAYLKDLVQKLMNKVKNNEVDLSQDNIEMKNPTR